MAHVIAITNQKGGVGKTTTAINLGAALAEMGRYTLLGDLDPQGGLSLGLGLAAHDLDLSIYNILTDTRIPIAGITHHVRPHLDLLPSNIDLAVAEFQLIAQMGREYILREALQSVRSQYEYIILDCPPSLNLLTVNALTAADAIVVPLQVEYFAMRGLEQLMDVVSRVRRRLNPGLEIIGIVPTMVDVRRTNDQQIIQEVTKAYPGMLMDVYIKESIKFADAPRQQRSILELDPRHDGARSYRKLARLVLQYYGEYIEPEPYPVPEETESSAAASQPYAVSSAETLLPVETAEPSIQPESMIQTAEPVIPVEDPELLLEAKIVNELLPMQDTVVPVEPATVEPPIITESRVLMPQPATADPPVPIENPGLLLAPRTAEITAGPSDIERAVELTNVEPAVTAPPTNGAHAERTDFEIPPVQDLVNPTRDLPRDGVL